MHPLASRLRQLIVEGPIGAGKTTLAQRLAHTLGARLVLEEAAANPFLESFYRDSARYALSTQLAFLLQRVAQIQALSGHDRADTPLVADFILEKDPIFAELTLSADELVLYRQIYASVALAGPEPDLVILLEARPAVLAERIARRGLAMESAISLNYLADLSSRYTRFFYQYNAAPLLIVNTEHLNPVDDDADYLLLLERISQMRGRREHFNRAA